MQRHPAFAIPLHAGDFGAAEPAEQLIRMPCAPNRIADCTARFIARRNATRRSSCSAMPSATSFASISGLRNSTMLRLTSLNVTLAMSVRSFSMSAPFLPMITPGRAECSVIRLFAARSMTIATPGLAQAPIEKAAQLEIVEQEVGVLLAREAAPKSQVRLMPRRSPIGLTFWPI